MKFKYKSMSEYCAEYVRYLGIAKTERRSYAESVRLLEKRGFRDISKFKTLKPGDKVYRGYEGRTVMAAVIGRRKISEAGLKVVGGHTDAPRLDLKPRPLYEKGGYVYFDCHIYGGIKKYQWLVMPLALYGTVVRKDGTKIEAAEPLDAPEALAYLRSDDVELAPWGTEAKNSVPGTIDVKTYLGRRYQYNITTPLGTLVARVEDGSGKVGDKVALVLPPERMALIRKPQH